MLRQREKHISYPQTVDKYELSTSYQQVIHRLNIQIFCNIPEYNYKNLEYIHIRTNVLANECSYFVCGQYS